MEIADDDFIDMLDDDDDFEKSIRELDSIPNEEIAKVGRLAIQIFYICEYICLQHVKL